MARTKRKGVTLELTHDEACMLTALLANTAQTPLANGIAESLADAGYEFENCGMIGTVIIDSMTTQGRGLYEFDGYIKVVGETDD